jgi:hypothetical protein
MATSFLIKRDLPPAGHPVKGKKLAMTWEKMFCPVTALCDY